MLRSKELVCDLTLDTPIIGDIVIWQRRCEQGGRAENVLIKQYRIWLSTKKEG